MPLLHLMVEDMCQLLGRHALASIGHRQFYIAVALSGRDIHLSAILCKLTGIVGQRVQHKQGEHAVGLDGSLCGMHAELYTLHAEAGLTTGHDVE